MGRDLFQPAGLISPSRVARSVARSPLRRKDGRVGKKRRHKILWQMNEANFSALKRIQGSVTKKGLLHLPEAVSTLASVAANRVPARGAVQANVVRAFVHVRFTEGAREALGTHA